MKSLLFIGLTLIVASCNGYQEPAKILEKTITAPIQTGSGEIGQETSNEKSLSENMQLFLDTFLISIDEESDDTLFDYDSLYNKKEDANIVELRSNILTQIARTNFEDLSKNEKIAFLINSYNYLAIHTVISNYILPSGEKLASITDIGGTGSFAAFSSVKYNVAGMQLSLDGIEKQTLKPILTHSTEPLKIDARFHFAVICAAKGCPILMKEAYRAEDVNEQLDQATKSGLELKRNYAPSSTHLNITNLFSWYKDDFLNHSLSSDEEVAGSEKMFIQQFKDEVLPDLPIQFIDYDWSLNSYAGDSI